jgi:ribonuclease P protein component
VKNTIKSAAEISLLFEKAKRINTGHLIALIADVNERRGLRGRVAFIAGKKLGSAPQRNKAKRIMREAAQKVGAPWPGKDVVFLAKTQLLSADLVSVTKDVSKIKQEIERDDKKECLKGRVKRERN